MLRLALFDIDGTLVTGHDRHNATAWAVAIEEVLGLRGARPADVPHAGMTDRATLLKLALHHGLPREAALARLESALAHKDRVLAELLEREPHGAPLAATPGALALVVTLVERGVLVGLVTGNTPYAALTKLERAGFDPDHFSVGGFGQACDTRGELVRTALRDASDWLPSLRSDEVLVVGDTPLDVASGRDNGCRSLAVCTGRGLLDELRLAGPSLLLPDLAQPGLLAALALPLAG